MAYNRETWTKRHRNRSDVSTYITHLTKEGNGLDSLQVLKKILTEKKILGSNRNDFIIGNKNVVCFQDIPLYGVCQNTYHEQSNHVELGSVLRYRPIGLTFEKQYVFNKGARPVVYEKKNIAKGILPDSEWWRIVNYDLSNPNAIVDWTHEREWRLLGDFDFELNQAIVIMPKGLNYNQMRETFGDEILESIKGVTILDPILT